MDSLKYIATLCVYFILLVTVGVFIARKKPDFDGYFFGKRKLGSFLIFFTVTAAWFGAASTLATIEAAYKTGFQAVWLLGIPTIITVLIFILVNNKIREVHFVSLPVLLGKYYGKGVSRFATFLIFFYMILLAASQFVAWGKFISTFLGYQYKITIIIGALTVILYSYLGGYFSIALTDGIQFVLIALSLAYLMVFFSHSTPVFKPGDFHLFSNPSYHIFMTISFILAWTISPIIWQRIASAKSARTSRSGLIFSVFSFIVLYYMVIRIGIYLRSTPGTSGENLFGSFIHHWLPVGGSLLVFLGIAAAIMSTADTAINIASLTLVKDVLPLKHTTRSVFWGRLSTFFSGILAALIALRFDSIIKTLGLASEIMAEGLFIPGMYLLFFKKKRPLAALFSLILGGGFSLLVFLNAYGLSLPLPQWPYSLPYGLSLSLIGFFIGFLFQRNSGKIKK